MTRNARHTTSSTLLSTYVVPAQVNCAAFGWSIDESNAWECVFHRLVILSAQQATPNKNLPGISGTFILPFRGVWIHSSWGGLFSVLIQVKNFVLITIL